MAKPKQVPERLAYSISEAGQLLGGIGRSVVYDLIGSGDLASILVKRRRKIPRVAIDLFIARQLEKADAIPEEVSAKRAAAARKGAAVRNARKVSAEAV